MDNGAKKPAVLVSAEEESSLSRQVLVWLNTYPDLPVAIINYESLRDDEPSMAMSSMQGAAIVRRYIAGGHMAEYQFKVIYRIKPGNSNDKRLDADELLNRLGAWAQQNPPVLAEGLTARTVRAASRSSLFARYESGDEDHQIFITLTYEVI